MPKAPDPKEIRQAFADYMSEWQDIREQGQTDMRYISGDPWDPKERQAREDAKRPCISMDELNQYTNQAINNIRQNKRSIKVLPTGEGANDQLANHRENIIRGIEYRSNGQQAYISAYESALQASMGFFRLTTGYASEDSFEQELLIKPIANWTSVLLSPFYKQPDASDVDELFVFDAMPRATFKRRFPKADIEGWDDPDGLIGKTWVSEKQVQVAEFWKAHKTERTLLLVQDGAGKITTAWESEYDRASGRKVLKERKATKTEVIQYLTNGVEILDKTPWLGTRIPIISVFGKEIWVDDGGGSKRQLISMVRLARDAQMMMNYIRSLQAEEAGQTPKVPYLGAKGQFDVDEGWETANKIPKAYLEYDPTPEGANGQIMPPPSRVPFVPNFSEYEVFVESSRRAVQASMGITPLPTAAQRNNDKSGVALERIQQQESVGSFHFTDNFDRALQNAGWQINELIPLIYDTEREIPIATADGKHDTIVVNSQIQEEGRESVSLHEGQFDVTISTGPSYQSQREEASEFVDHLIDNMPNLPIPPAAGTKLLALGIKMKNIGPLGDQMAEILDPPQDQEMPPQAQAAIAQLQGQIQQLSQENAGLHMERAGKVLEQQTKVFIENMKQENENLRAQLNADLKAYIANVQTKAQVASERERLFQETQTENHHAAHDLGMQAQQHAHEQDLAKQQAANAAAQQSAQIAADQQAQANSQQSQ